MVVQWLLELAPGSWALEGRMGPKGVLLQASVIAQARGDRERLEH